MAVILALERVLGDNGTLVMPTHSNHLSDPVYWENPPVPRAWWNLIRDTMPAYDPDLTPTSGMGVIPETFRKQRGVRRSGHPQLSFAAWGAQTAEIVEEHGLDFGLGEDSPLARIYDRKGWVLLLGVKHDSNTSLHLAEYRADYPGKKHAENGAPLWTGGQRQWVKLNDLELDTSDFVRLGQSFADETGLVLRGRVGQARAWLMPQHALVDFAVSWLEKHRKAA